MSLPPEALARQQIDTQLVVVGRTIQDIADSGVIRGQRRAFIQRATGADKTFTICSFTYGLATIQKLFLGCEKLNETTR